MKSMITISFTREEAIKLTEQLACNWRDRRFSSVERQLLDDLAGLLDVHPVEAIGGQPRTTNNLPDPLFLRLKEFRTAPPLKVWEYAVDVPAQYEILAEFPCVTWGWESDLYQWILRDPLSGEVFLGGTAYGRFFKSSNSIDSLKEDINRLTEYVGCAQLALKMLIKESPITPTQEDN